MSLRSTEPRGAIEPLACFADNGAHLRAELAWLHELVRMEIQFADRRGNGPGMDEFAGLYVSREEISRYLDAPSAAAEAWHGDETLRELRERVAAERGRLDRRVELSTCAGTELRLQQVVQAFDLDGLARAALVCCAAAELDGHISRLFAYLQNDATKRRPTFALLARLLSPQCVDPVGVRALFGPASALHVHRLLEPVADTADIPFSLREARLAPGIVDFLIGSDRLPALLAEAVESVPEDAALGDLTYHRHHREAVELLLRLRRAEGTLQLAYIGGPRGAGDRLIAQSLAKTLGKKLLVVQAARISTAAGRIEDFARMLAREARLRGGILLIEDCDDLLRESERETGRGMPLDMLLHGLSGCEVIASGTLASAEARHRMRTRPLGIELAYPTLAERTEIWERCLPPALRVRLAPEIWPLAAKFHFTPGQIARVVDLAAMAAPGNADGAPDIGAAELYARCREEAESGLHQFCLKIVPRYGWDDVVLAADAIRQLQEICRWVKHRARVYDGWGFGDKLAYGKGIAVLFSGASGTGKTMSAEVIARDLQLDLFRVDLARVVSKYIGETERNLSRIFSQTSSGNCVLFFDEADALFGKRTEVKDAHDRYANIEINYLLAEMDRYEGVIIIATNMKGNLDQAFIRRFSHVVEYPLPDEGLREIIWRKSFPHRTPLGSDVDFAFLAQKFNVPGGSIRNIALSSAFLAAADDGKVTMRHVILATKREYQKIGRVCSKSDFGQYYGIVREAEVA
jgi:AAA+ superfamily predicted ATPase